MKYLTHKIQKYLQSRFNLLFIFALILSNYKICMYFFENDLINFFKLKYSFYSVIIILALRYKFKNIFEEHLLIAIILNNVYGYYQNEFNYSINDLVFIITYLTLRYVHSYKRNYRIIINRINNFFYNFDKKK
jgi:hypothetical protein